MSEDNQRSWTSGTAVVVWIAVASVVIHVATGWRYGFDRDELMALEDARHLAWGYVQYPPMTAFFGWVALRLFGTSLVGFRLFAALAQATALVLAGLLAREMGGTRWAVVVTALAGVPFCLGAGALMQYISFDYVCWVFVVWCVAKVAKQDDARWWVGAGIGVGLGMQAKYTMVFLACGLVAGIVLTPMRRHLRSGWLWLGMVAAAGIFLPNFLWEWQREFVSLEFLRFLHVRDVGQGLTDWFLVGQLELTLLAAPLAVAGLWFLFFAAEGNRFRILGWMYAVPLVLFLVMRGRDYYLAPGYPMLYAAGAVWLEPRISRLVQRDGKRGAWVRRGIWTALAADIVLAAVVALPLAPVNSRWWKFAADVDTVFPEEIGWPEFVEAVARVRDSLPGADRESVTILAGNYGEIGALNLYGPQRGLPQAISGVNSSWERGYGEPSDLVIVVGYPRALLDQEFASCVVGGRVWNLYGVANEETIEDPDIFVCRGLKGTWAEFWKKVRKFA